MSGRCAKDTLPCVAAALSAVAIVAFLRAFVVGLYIVPSASMEPTILAGDYVAGDRIGLATGGASVGDVVTFASPEGSGATLVKRVVAVAGQEVDLRGGRVFVDGIQLEEPYAVGRTLAPDESAVAYPHVVTDGCVWVMGDNRARSRDSRAFGDVPVASLSSRITLRYWPPWRAGPSDDGA